MNTTDGSHDTKELPDLGLDLLSFADGLPGGFFIYEAHGKERILFANAQMAALFGCASVDEFLEHVHGTFSGMVFREDLLRVENAVWSQVGDAAASQVEGQDRDHVTYRIVAKDGSIHYLDEYGRLVKNTSAGDVFFVFVADITGDSRLAGAQGSGRIHEVVSADVDALTGLPTMRYYHRHSGEVLARAATAGVPMVDVYFDVDHFRTVNFRLGYEGGDEVLQRVGRVLRSCFPDDLLARFSDDHFVLVTRREGVEERLEQVHDRVAHLVSGMSIELKAGVYELAANDVSIPFAHDRAKVACASIKGRYDRHYRFYDASLAISENQRDYIINNLDRAAAEGWIRNYYQPVIRVATGLTCGAEALSRWVDPEFGMMPPSQYVHVLEEARMIHRLDSVVIRRACKDLRRALAQVGTAVPLSINFSPSALTLLDVPQLIEENARRYDIPRDLLHVEITESSLADDPELLRSVIGRLHAYGYEVWMDDFGSGYSSLNLLKDYDFDVLKVDMEFLRGMEGNDRSRTIVRSITDLAHSLGMVTLVEGVETQSQFEFLQSVGADRAQGFLFSEPVPYEQLVGDFFLRYPPEQREKG